MNSQTSSHLASIRLERRLRNRPKPGIAIGVVACMLFSLASIHYQRPILRHLTDLGLFAHPRATILDRNGVVLAQSELTSSLYADARQVADPKATGAALAKILPGLDQSDLVKRLSSGRRFVYLARQLPRSQQRAIAALAIPGLAFKTEQARTYPTGALMSHPLGFTDIDNKGLAGVENSADSLLKSSSNRLSLTIDTRVQAVVRSALLNAMQVVDAAGAAGIVMNARNGEVVAAVSLPDFNPNREGRGSADASAQFNRTTLGLYEIGDMFDLFATANLLTEHPESAATTASEPAAPAAISAATLSEASTVGANKALLDRLGLTRRGALEVLENGTPLYHANPHPLGSDPLAAGRGAAVAPIQLVAAFAALVNGGQLPRPTLLLNRPHDASESVFSPEASRMMRRRLGNGMITGMTGHPSPLGLTRLHPTFLAAVPASAPKYIVYLMLDNPPPTQRHGIEDTLHVAANAVTGSISAALVPQTAAAD